MVCVGDSVGIEVFVGTAVFVGTVVLVGAGTLVGTFVAVEVGGLVTHPSVGVQIPVQQAPSQQTAIPAWQHADPQMLRPSGQQQPVPQGI
jgi:hypothetical protein